MKGLSLVSTRLCSSHPCVIASFTSGSEAARSNCRCSGPHCIVFGVHQLELRSLDRWVVTAMVCQKVWVRKYRIWTFPSSSPFLFFIYFCHFSCSNKYSTMVAFQQRLSKRVCLYHDYSIFLSMTQATCSKFEWGHLEQLKRKVTFRLG